VLLNTSMLSRSEPDVLSRPNRLDDQRIVRLVNSGQPSQSLY
jgi:hypothetical protein